MQQLVMFCHDGSTIFYPTAPGRVYHIGIAALSDCSGSDEDLSDSTEVADLSAIMMAGDRLDVVTAISMPDLWPRVYHVDGGDISGPPDLAATRDDFHDALEQWADWCDRDSAQIDSLDAIMGALEVAA